MFANSNLVVAAGALDTGQGRFAVKVPGLFETMADIVNLPVKVNGDAVVRFRDVASLRRTFKDSDGFSRINGQPSLALEVSQRTGENIIEPIESLRSVVEAQRANRSEERRIGKEGVSQVTTRWSQTHQKHKYIKTSQ